MDETIEEDNEVRLIDLFVNSLDMGKMGFKVDYLFKVTNENDSKAMGKMLIRAKDDI